MNEKDLQRLLQSVDTTPSAPAPVGDVAGEVLRQVRCRRLRQRKQRILVAAAVVLIAGLGTGWSLLQFRPDHATEPPAVADAQVDGQGDSLAIETLQQDLERLRREIDQTSQRLATLLEKEKELRAAGESASLDDLVDPLAVQREMTAAALLLQAQRRYDKLGLTASAVEEWQTIVRCYPQTEAARTAREKLAQLNRDTQGGRHDRTKSKHYDMG